ncbi:adenine nucleotide translocase lysine N-methyltransferase [Menidia menidia]
MDVYGTFGRGTAPHYNVSVSTTTGMDDDTPNEAFAELNTRPLGGWGVAQIAAGTGLAVYAMWVGILQPGFRKVPLRLQVPYIPASKAQVNNVMTLLRGRKGGLVDLGSGDGRIVLEAHQHGFSPAVGYELNPWLVQLARFHAWRAGHHEKVSYRREDLWKVDLTKCKNITVFLAPSVLSLLQEKLQAELPEDALVVAGRFPFPDWTPCRIEGRGVDRAWAYSMEAQRQHTLKKTDESVATSSGPENELSTEKLSF